MLQPNSSPDNNFQPGSALVPVQTESSADYYLKVGKSLYQSYLARSRQPDLDAAIQHFQKAVEIEPNLAEGYIQLASALWDQGTINLELAQFYCETAIRLDPKQADANLFLGYFLQRAGFLDEAIMQYSRAVQKSFWKSARARIALGHARLKQSLQMSNPTQQFGAACQGVAQFAVGCGFLAFDPATCHLLQEALLTDAQVYIVNGTASGFKKLGLTGLSRQALHFGMQMLPKESLFYHLMGDIYLYEDNEPQKAIVYYQQALTLEPKDMMLLKKIGKSYALLQDYENAANAVQAVIDLDNQDFDSLNQLAFIYTEQMAYTKALYYYKETCRLQPQNPYIHSSMAYVLFKMEDLEGAFEEYKLAQELGTDPIWLSTVSQTLGTICYQLTEDAQESLVYFQQAMHYHPENTECLAMLADLYFETGKLEHALSAYKTMLMIEPESADCYSNIGYILWQMDQNQAAIDAYLTALHYDADNAVAYNNLGVIYLDDESAPDTALPLFQKAYDLNPQYTLACFNMGRTLYQLGEAITAAEHFSQALFLNQINPELDNDEIQAHLDRLFD